MARKGALAEAYEFTVMLLPLPCIEPYNHTPFMAMFWYVYTMILPTQARDNNNNSNSSSSNNSSNNSSRNSLRPSLPWLSIIQIEDCCYRFLTKTRSGRQPTAVDNAVKHTHTHN